MERGRGAFRAKRRRERVSATPIERHEEAAEERLRGAFGRCSFTGRRRSGRGCMPPVPEQNETPRATLSTRLHNRAIGNDCQEEGMEMTLEFRRERLFPDTFGEMRELLERHWDEVALKDVSGPLDIDENMYRLLEANGNLVLVTAREDGVPAGYAAYLLGPNPHYRSLAVAEADVFYLAPEYRRGLAGLRLLRAAERECVRAGARIIQNKVKLAHDCGRLFERMGYTAAEKLYVKAVG